MEEVEPEPLLMFVPIEVPYNQPHNLSEAFPTVLKLIREAEFMSQGELALKMKIPRTWISKLERGRAAPTLKTLLRFSEIFDAHPYRLIQMCEALARVQ